MTDRTSSGAAPPDPPHGEVLSAYLSGELDARATAELEKRLDADPDLARRLDDTARVLVSLLGVDEVEPPPGAGGRLRERLATARADAPAGQPATVTPLSPRRRVPWPALTGVAAGLVALALVGGSILQGFGAGDMAAEDSATGDAPADEELRALEAAPEQRQSGEDGVNSLGEDAGTPPAPAGAPEHPVPEPQAPRAGSPVIIDEDLPLAGEGDVAARYSGLPEATALLTEPLEEASGRAASYRAELAAARPFSSGARPDDCLDGLLAAAGTSAVPVRVESALFAGEAAVVHVLVVASEGSSVLDRVEVWVMEPAGCDARLFLDVTEP